MEQVVAVLDRQRHENELLLRALAQGKPLLPKATDITTDLTGEIRGERIRFVEAMQQATSVNVQRESTQFRPTLKVSPR